MEAVGALSVCAVLTLIVAVGYGKGLSVFNLFTTGAREGLRTALRLLPTLVGLITAISMLRASGVLELFCGALRPLTDAVGVDPSIVPLALLRPFSGSAAMASLADIFNQYGADSMVGYTASVLMGSSETIFYEVALYFGAVGVKKTRFAIPVSLAAMAAGVIASVIVCSVFFS